MIEHKIIDEQSLTGRYMEVVSNKLHNPEKVVDFWSVPYNRPVCLSQISLQSVCSERSPWRRGKPFASHAGRHRIGPRHRFFFFFFFFFLIYWCCCCFFVCVCFFFFVFFCVFFFFFVVFFFFFFCFFIIICLLELALALFYLIILILIF